MLSELAVAGLTLVLLILGGVVVGCVAGAAIIVLYIWLIERNY